MSWMKRLGKALVQPLTVAVPPPAPAATAAPEPLAAPPKPAEAPASPPVPKPAANRPLPPHLAARAAAARAVAESLRKAQSKAEAADAARRVLSALGVSVPAPPPPAPILSPQRRALVSEAMRHWARGHQIFESLDPGLKDRVRAIAERMAPK